MAKPFLKWAGGKGQLLRQLEDLLPPAIRDGGLTNYCEPFIGGGAMFFHVAERYAITSAYLSDLNPDLIVAYDTVQSNVTALIDRLQEMASHYAGLALDCQKPYFYKVREAFNRDRLDFDYTTPSDRWVQRAAWLLFLNKTCFNGLYRVNKKGGFNVPFGKYKNPRIVDEANLLRVSELLAIAEIRWKGFEGVLDKANRSSFVYFDPPYRPISRTSNFTSYSACSFDDNEQRRLALVFAELDNRGAQVMLSNSDPKNTDPDDEFFDNLYSDYVVTRVSCRRSINSKADRRGTISEIAVTNYDSPCKAKPLDSEQG